MLDVLIVLAASVAGLGGLYAVHRRQAAAPKVADVVEGALQFKSYVGLRSPFFVPRSGDVPPTADLTGPMGMELPIDVCECNPHPDFGARWQLCVPRWAIAGNYRINVSSGEVYDISVKE